nr:VOC family protein [uncultured Gellertiella sp.]
MSLDRRISVITLGVADPEASTAFYARLGWTKSPASVEGVTFIQMKGTALVLLPRDVVAAYAGVEDDGSRPSRVMLSHFVSSTVGVDAVMKFAVSCGATLVKAPALAYWGGYAGYLADPDGHLWEIAHTPNFQMNGQGHIQLPADD